MVDRFYGTTPSPFDTLGSRDPRAAADRAIQEIDQYARSIRAGLVTQTQQMMQPEVEPTQRTARVAYDPTQGKYFIGGFLVDENNDTDIATMAKFAGQEAPLPEGNWQTVDDASFAQYVQSIRSPDTLKLMAKNFGMGFDEMQQMAGYGLQWLGAEELGRGIVAQQERDLAPNQIYNRNFTDIGSSPEQGVLDWMAATIGRLGPNIVESTISAAIGAGIGGATTGPAAAAGAPIGAIAGFFGKTAVKKALLEAAKKQLKGETLEAAEKKLLISAAATSSAAKEALEKQAKKQALTAADEAAITGAASANALMDTTRAAGLSRLAPGAFGQYMDEALTGGAIATRNLVGRRAAQVGGAAGASFASNVFQQTGAAYGETMADGGEGNRAVALAVGIPGALADTIPEFILAGRLFSELGGDIVGAAKKQKSAMDILKGAASGRTGRIAGYAGAGAAIEGATEGFQEILQIAANPILDLNSKEGANRVVNALAAGALMGGTLGGASGAFAGNLASNKQETDLLLPLSNNDPNYAQYRADLKAKLGEAEYNKVFGPPQPYTRLMEESAAQADLQAQRQAAMDAQRQSAQQFVSGMPGTAQPVPAERLLGLAPQGAPVTPNQQLRQDAAAFFGGQAPSAPVTIPSTPTPVVAQQQALQQQALQQIQQAAQQTFGGQPQAAPITVPPMAPPGTAAPLPIAPIIQQRGEAQAQAQEQARRAATDRIVTQRQQELARGRAQRFVAGPQRQPIAQAPMGAGMTTTVTVPPTAPLPQTTGARPTLSMAGETTAAMQQRLKRGKKGGKTTVNVPTGTAASVETLSTGSVPELTPNITKAPESIRTFLNALLLKGQKVFNETDIAKHIFSKMGKVTKLLKLEKLSRKQKDQVQRFADTMVNKLRVAERSGIGKDGEEFNITRETVDAFNAGTGGAGLRTLAEIPADRAAGEQPTAEPGAGGKAGTRNRGRNRKPTTREEPASETQGSAAGSKQAQAEADVPPAVKPRRKPLKKEPQPPKAPEGAAPSKEAAEPKAEEKARKAEEKARKAEEKARKAEEAARVKAEKKAQREREEAEREANKYENLSEEQQIALAKEGALAGGKIATLMEREQDVPSLPLTATKEERDLFEVHGTIGNIIFAQRENRREGVKVSVKDEAKRTFVSNVAILLRWASDTGMEPKARNMARAYLESEITADENAPLKKGVQQAIDDAKQGMFMLSQFDLVENPIDENGRPAKGVNPIRVKAIVDKFRSGLAKAPQFYVYKNQADLQRRNPALYQQAVGSRPQGDFDTARASGFAFDGKVLVFTDRIPTEKYMRLLLAHESIGHFGMRALLPASKFDALMDYVYENNMAVRRAADSKLAGSTDLGARREAVEEYMAKYAEKLDSSVITRVWNAIKDVLNKLGIKFEDDIVRYLVSQARRTVREGSSMFTPSTFALNVHTITTNNGTGRFSTAPLLTGQHAASNAFFLMNAPPANIEQANKTLKDFKIDSADKFERFVRTFLRQGNYAALRSHGVEYYQNLLQSMATAAKELVFRFNQRLGALLALNGDSRRMVSNAFVVSRRIANRRYALPKDLRDKPLLILGDAQPDETREIKGDEEVIRKLVAIGTLSKKELEDGAEVTYEEPTEGGKFEKVTVQIPGLKGLLGRELTQEEYDLYKKTREDLAALDVERLKGQFQNFLATEKISTKGIRKVIADKNMTEEDVTFVKGIVNHAKNLFISEIDYDERGIASITPKGAGRMEKYFAAINNAVVKREFTDDLKAEVRKFYLPEPTKDEDGNVKEPSAEALAEGNKKSEAAIKRIEAFRSRRTEFTGKEEQSVIYTLQDRIKEIVLADAAFDKAQAAVRRSIASSHVPLWREGAWQVRVEAQINGKPQKLHPEVQNKMILSLHEKPSEAENVAALINEKMKDLEYSGLVYNEETGEYKTQTFKLFAVPSKTVDSVASDPSIDIDNLLYTLRVLGQPLTPDKHAKAITMLTAPGSALRKALRFDDSPGYDPNRTIDAIARHVTTRASLIAKTRYQPVMRELLDRTTELGQKWFGDKEAVMTAKENFDKATDQKAKDYWQDTLTTELYKYIAVNPGAKGWDGSRATFPNQPTKASLGMRDYSDAVKTTEWLMDSANINESTFEGKRYAALAKMVTSVGFLGGVMTQFAQNLMSFATNVFPLLASKDSQTGFGGGFGFAVMPMYLRSFKDANFTGFNAFSDPIKEAQAFDKIAAEIKAARDAGDRAKEAALIQQYNLNYYEALNIAREIREGKLIPSQALALLETARGIFTGRFGKGFLKFSDWYMLPFNVSEQATRRASFLTAFRLEFDRLKQAGFSEDKASEMARMFAVKVIDDALGNYDASNRPPIWRDGLMSMLFVYKTYPLTSLSLFKNLSRNGKIGMLTALWVLAGAAGFPLVDDMEDIIDTLSQRLGLDLGQGPAVRMAIIRQLEEVFPGWSDMILRGPLNHYTGADIGAKFGLEDFIPGTGIFLKGANTTEELKDIAGPVLGMGLSMGKFAYDAIRAPLSSTVSAVDVLRESPISLMRAGGDVAAYLQNGAIVDRRGYVVTPEVSAMALAARLLGFYPAEAAKQYDFIKYANRMNYDYKEVGMAYKLAWIKAKKTGNEREAARIVREVNEWNEANKGGPGVIRNFLKNAQRQLKEANRPAGERFLKAAPVASRAEYDRFLEYITGE